MATRPPIWWDSRCRESRGSAFAGTIFARPRLGFARALMLGLAFAEGAGYDEARRYCTFSGGDAPLPNHTIARWYRRYRRVVAGASRASVQVGGPGRIVQVDEALIHGRRKYGVGRVNTQVWVLGVIDDEGRMRLGVVRDRGRCTLLRHLRRWIRPGSEVHTDGWRAYRGLERLGFTHRVVNHRERFVALDETHTQRIEAQWRSVRRVFSRGGIRALGVPARLREWLWRRACYLRGVDPFEALLQALRLD
jgi:transposase-like protein